MIKNGSKAEESFLRFINTRVFGAGSNDPAPTVTYEGRPTVYWFGGYWRAWCHYEAGKLIGVSLVNPDRTPSEISTAEEGLAILHQWEYQRGSPDPVVDAEESERVAELRGW